MLPGPRQDATSSRRKSLRGNLTGRHDRVAAAKDVPAMEPGMRPGSRAAARLAGIEAYAREKPLNT